MWKTTTSNHKTTFWVYIYLCATVHIVRFGSLMINRNRLLIEWQIIHLHHSLYANPHILPAALSSFSVFHYAAANAGKWSLPPDERGLSIHKGEPTKSKVIETCPLSTKDCGYPISIAVIRSTIDPATTRHNMPPDTERPCIEFASITCESFELKSSGPHWMGRLCNVRSSMHRLYGWIFVAFNPLLRQCQRNSRVSRGNGGNFPYPSKHRLLRGAHPTAMRRYFAAYCKWPCVHTAQR